MLSMFQWSLLTFVLIAIGREGKSYADVAIDSNYS